MIFLSWPQRWKMLLADGFDFLIRSDVEAMKDVEARNLILKSAVTVYVP